MKFAAAIAFASLIPPALAETDGVQFFRDEVKPILEQNCFKCHGGNDEKGHPKIKGELQLISRKGLMKGGNHGPAFNEAEPGASVILNALSYANHDLQMPPSGKLPEDQLGKIHKWLDMGAPWTPEDADRLVEVHDASAGTTAVNDKTRAYWSYRPMERYTPPAVKDPAWAVNPIDAFLRAGMEKKGVTPAPPAPRAALLRRVSYDLTGLPPTLEEIQAFEADTAPDAWDKQVERLLASPAYGEKWARHWLDIVRYAESNGFERDNDKPFVWRYRDYAIKSFNDDKPYDRFVMEQIAGDELPDKNAETEIATGIFRLMAWDDEPADREQHFYDVLDDNVRTVTEGFLGMTAGCARCHDHKGDPIPQKDYYKFVSFFRGIEPMGRAGRQTMFLPTPEVKTTDPTQIAELAEEEVRIREYLKEVETEAVETIRQKQPDVAARLSDSPGMEHWLVTDARLRPTNWFYTLTKPPEDWSAVNFRAEHANWLEGQAGFGTAAPGVQARTVWTSSDIWLQTTFGLQDMPKAVLLHLYHDEDIEIFLNGQPVLQRSGFNCDYEKISASPEFMAALQTGRNVLAVHVTQKDGGQFFDMGLEIDAVTPSFLVLQPEFAAVSDAERQRYRNGLARLTEIDERKRTPGIEALVITETGPVPPPTFINIRGSAHALGEEVHPGFPAIFGGQDAVIPEPLPGATTSGRRLALAKWIASPDNPRTARVMMNRIWEHHFGRGIAPSPNDFGYLGIPATHPELLDWLATEFIRQGWSIKAMHRLILHSKAYLTSIDESDEGHAKDPGNDLFHRFNPRRITAEELRDSILSSTGELNRQMGGPSVYITMPPEILATSSTKGAKWGESTPEQAARRSVYVKTKRSLQIPLFTDFDAADTDNTCPVRFTTTVPTQALAMMNSAFIHEEAAKLAERLKTDRPGDLQAQIRRSFELVLSREPNELEIVKSLGFIGKMKTEHHLDADTALQRFCVAIYSFNEFFYLD
ncbi:MAG: hypothetical protein JWO82_104 [Akkermansiaceae bacterium]|nr:hypothetical protein [Akkermansiaceae bacterium]